MTNRMTSPPDARKVIVGVDTHKHVHVAVAINTWGIRLGDQSFVADSGGYQALITWAETHGRLEPQMVVLGSMSLGGNIVPVENLAESLQVAAEAGAKRLLPCRWPASATSQQYLGNSSPNSRPASTPTRRTGPSRRWACGRAGRRG